MQSITSHHFFKQLSKLAFIDAIWLYGSRARGEQNERSDIDLAIICPKANEADWRQVRDIIEAADTLLEIDYVRFDELAEDDPLRENILDDKQVLYSRESLPNWYENYVVLGQALARLEEMMHEPEDRNSYVKDATIQRFELAVELMWKCLKKICQAEGYETNSPKNTLQKAYSIGLLDDEKVWLDMLVDRNLTSHTYKKHLADEIYQKAKLYYVVMQKTFDSLKLKYQL